MFQYGASDVAAPGLALAHGTTHVLVQAERLGDVAPVFDLLRTDEPDLDSLGRVIDDIASTWVVMRLAADGDLHVIANGAVSLDFDNSAESRLTPATGHRWWGLHIAGARRVVAALGDSTEASRELVDMPAGCVPASAIGVSLGVSELAEAVADAAAALTAPETVSVGGAAADQPDRAAEPISDAAPPSAPAGLGALMSSHRWTLRLPDGNEVDLAKSIVLGRRPWRSSPEETATDFILAPSPLGQISRQHVEISRVGDELHVKDLGATNGTLIVSPGGHPRVLDGGRDMVVREGETVDLGEGFTVQVGTRT